MQCESNIQSFGTTALLEIPVSSAIQTEWHGTRDSRCSCQWLCNADKIGTWKGLSSRPVIGYVALHQMAWACIGERITGTCSPPPETGGMVHLVKISPSAILIITQNLVFHVLPFGSKYGSLKNLGLWALPDPRLGAPNTKNLPHARWVKQHE